MINIDGHRIIILQLIHKIYVYNMILWIMIYDFFPSVNLSIYIFLFMPNL